MNQFVFCGRLAETPELKHNGTSFTRIRLIRNEYAGKDDAGNRRERTVTIPFTVWAKLAESVAKHCLVGDQLVVHARITNNNYTDANQVDRYDYNFDVETIEFGAPGPQKRKLLADNAADPA